MGTAPNTHKNTGKQINPFLESKETKTTVFDFIKLAFQEGFENLRLEEKSVAKSCSNFEQYNASERYVFNVYNFPEQCICHLGYHGEWCNQENKCTCRLGTGSTGKECVHGTEHCQSCDDPGHEKGREERKDGRCHDGIYAPIIHRDRM